MEEELNENELEERLYALLHHVDETQTANSNNNDCIQLGENAPKSTLRRYWRTSGDNSTPYQKVNTPKEPSAATANKNDTTNKPRIKEQRNTPVQPADLSIFQSPVPQNLQKKIEILENDEVVVELESSDEDEVVEVALPPKPTITIESSDEDDVRHATTNVTQCKDSVSQDKAARERDVSASPVPSVVSSVSDDFIRSDCIALKISSRKPNNQSFDFSLHGADLLGQSTPSKKKKRKKNKEVTNTNDSAINKSTASINDQLFATPKSKAKNKTQKSKSDTVSEKSFPTADFYDSDSNQSTMEINKSINYSVTERSFPSIDVYESDSSVPEIINKSNPNKQNSSTDVTVSDSSVSAENIVETPKKSRNNENYMQFDSEDMVVDLTDNSLFDNGPIEENFIMGNVTGFKESEDYNELTSKSDVSKLGSTKVPAILNEDLDFDNLKGTDKVCKRRRFSLTTLRAEMHKFYNESWGGEDFNHREIQKNMSRDKSLWVIDPKDRMPTPRRKATCNYCNRTGHRDDTCRLRPPVCFMCGSTGHFEPRCPRKICVNCGSPNHMYTSMCRNCNSWSHVNCAECGQNGHPASHCPDVWRRYHNTIDYTIPLEENRQYRKQWQIFCSGCTRRGHYVHTCRSSLPFSGLPINSPYVVMYRPLYQQTIDEIPQNDYNNKQNKPRSFQQDSTISSVTTPLRDERNKRQSKSPTVHETHVSKKRNLSDTPDVQRTIKVTQGQRNMSQEKEQTEENKTKELTNDVASETTKATPEKAPDYISITSNNHDKKGQIIQDNEVSDTSDAVTLARIYVTNEIVNKLKTKEGENWLKETTEKYSVSMQNSEVTSFLNIKGKLADQEAFQAELRDWTRSKTKDAKSDNEEDVSREIDKDQSSSASNIPKNRNNVLRKLSKALDSLKEDLGDPNEMYKELVYLQNRHQQLLKQKVISPKQLANNRQNMNEMLKKLNMILIGQAGLANGTQHLSELYMLQERLISYRQKNVSIDLRQEIGQHYHCIFTALPRDDYVDLLDKYTTKLTRFRTKKKEKSFKIQPRPILKKKLNSIPSPQKNGIICLDENNEKTPPRKPLVEKTIHKLAFYHKRLLNVRPTGPVLKKTRSALVRKLHSHIASLGKKTQISSKILKKTKKIQSQAQLFLKNI